MKSANIIRIPFRSTLSREDELALEAATEWVLAEFENGLFHRDGSQASVASLRRIAERELSRPRDDIHRRWAELFIRETNEIEFDHVRPEIRKLAQRGNVTPEEVAELRCNSWEWELLTPALTDEAFIKRMEHAIKNCSPGARLFTTYDQAVCGLYGPELIKRFKVASMRLNRFNENLDRTTDSVDRMRLRCAEGMNLNIDQIGGLEGAVLALTVEAKTLRAELESLRSFKRSVDEALNSGDGTYKP